jgi:hypothetical protein
MSQLPLAFDDFMHEVTVRILGHELIFGEPASALNKAVCYMKVRVKCMV